MQVLYSLFPEPDILRLVNGSNRCAGTVEMFHNGQWRRVEVEWWDIQRATVVCQVMDCGFAFAATKTNSRRDVPELGVLLSCIQRERCYARRVLHILYFAGVICSGNSWTPQTFVYLCLAKELFLIALFVEPKRI